MEIHETDAPNGAVEADRSTCYLAVVLTPLSCLVKRETFSVVFTKLVTVIPHVEFTSSVGFVIWVATGFRSNVSTRVSAHT